MRAPPPGARACAGHEWSATASPRRAQVWCVCVPGVRARLRNNENCALLSAGHRVYTPSCVAQLPPHMLMCCTQPLICVYITS